MKQLHNLMLDIIFNGKDRETRSGEVRSVFRRDFTHDMRTGLPFPMTKGLAFNAMMGELLWFLNGETDLRSLRMRSCLKDDAWTIWTNDYKRWAEDPSLEKGSQELGLLYGAQWRNFRGRVDQIANLVHNMQNSPTSRYLIVQAYDPEVVSENSAALAPCHTGFQVYVDTETGEFDLDWTQR